MLFSVSKFVLCLSTHSASSSATWSASWKVAYVIIQELQPISVIFFGVAKGEIHDTSSEDLAPRLVLDIALANQVFRTKQENCHVTLLKQLVMDLSSTARNRK